MSSGSGEPTLFFIMQLTTGDLIGIKRGTRIYDPGKKTWYKAGKSYTVKLKTTELPPKTLFENFKEQPMAYWKSGHRYRKAYLQDLYRVDPITEEWTPIGVNIDLEDIGVRSKSTLKCQDCANWQAGCKLQAANDTIVDLNMAFVSDLPYPKIYKLHFRNRISPKYNPASHCDRYCENEIAKLYFSNDA